MFYKIFLKKLGKKAAQPASDKTAAETMYLNLTVHKSTLHFPGTLAKLDRKTFLVGMTNKAKKENATWTP